MTDFKRKLLSAQEEADAIRPRLLALERDHLNVSLDIEIAGPGGNPPQESRKAHLEKTIAALRADLEKAERAATSTSGSG